MNKKSNLAANAACKGSALVVKADSANKTGKKFDPKDAQVVEPQFVTDTKAEEQLEPSAKDPSERSNQTQLIKDIRKIPTMQELKDSVTTLYILQEKHTDLMNKRASLNKFAIKHQKDNAEVVVTDANGEEFTSRSPKTIAKLIEFWKEEFDEAIKEVEKELQKMFLGEAA